MNYKKKILLLTPVLVFLMAVSLRPYLFKFLSRQDEIDPKNLTVEYDSEAREGVFNNKIVNVPQTKLEDKVLGVTTEEQSTSKRIEVDLTKQRAMAYDGDKLVYDFLISSGTYGRTPTGDFKVWAKVKAQKMSGGSEELGTYYYLPNVQNVMFFYNDKYQKKLGYSFHQAYWHNNFGVPMSHGCINMTTADSATLYAWADAGTPITIYGKYQTVLPRI